MYGAMIGDIVGSKYEFDNIKTKEFPVFSQGCDYTDDSVMTAAVAKAILLSREAQSRNENRTFEFFLIQQMRSFGARYPYPQGAYGGRFVQWLRAKYPEPYHSFGNGSAMRVSPCALVAVTLEEAQALARISAKVTHNHPEGIKGAEAVASAIFLAKTGCSKEEIKDYIAANYYHLTESVDEIRKTYRFDESCQGTVPQAITAFLESESFEDAIRNAISMGGDSDTVGAITGSIAWTYYWRQDTAYQIDMLPEDLQQIKDRASIYIPTEFAELAEELRKVAGQRARTHDRMGSCTSIMSPSEWEAEMK